MGVTIHYAGQLKDPGRLKQLLAHAGYYAQSHGWLFENIQKNGDASLGGFVIRPHADCEPLKIEFGPKGRFDGWVKTQFAGAGVHIQIVQLLRELKSILGRLGVRDEGEYWETRNEATLREHIATINEVIADAVDANPNTRTCVREPSGRIIDIIR